MKKIIILAFIVLMIVGCNKKLSDGTYELSSYNYKTYTIDSCEYVGIAESSPYDYLAHKGNCRYCNERRQQEMKELIKVLKEE